VFPVPIKKGKEYTLFFIATFRTIEITAAKPRMVLVLRSIFFREGDKKSTSTMNGKRIIYLSWVYVPKLAKTILASNAFDFCGGSPLDINALHKNTKRQERTPWLSLPKPLHLTIELY
jgi:hypothetical protein